MEIQGSQVRKIIVACDAGMGSSVMLASQLRRQVKKQQVEVEHSPLNSIPDDADVVVCHESLAERAGASAPETVIVGVQVFIGDPAVNRLVSAITSGETFSV